jgi:hypothetical protein
VRFGFARKGLCSALDRDPLRGRKARDGTVPVKPELTAGTMAEPSVTE